MHAFLRKDALIEVFADNEWWDARCVVFNKNFVRVHYVGGLWHLLLATIPIQKRVVAARTHPSSARLCILIRKHASRTSVRR